VRALPSADEALAARIWELAVLDEGTTGFQVHFPTGMAAAYAIKPTPIGMNYVIGEVERLVSAIERASMVVPVVRRGGR